MRNSKEQDGFGKALSNKSAPRTISQQRLCTVPVNKSIFLKPYRLLRHESHRRIIATDIHRGRYQGTQPTKDAGKTPAIEVLTGRPFNAVRLRC